MGVNMSTTFSGPAERSTNHIGPSTTLNLVPGSALGTPFLIGSAAILFSLGSLILWSCLATIASAIIVSGTVVVDTGLKSVQQLNGGLVSSIYVSEGQQVQAGQTLMRLDSSSLDLAHDSLSRLVAMNICSQARLTAEQRDATTVSFPASIASVPSRFWGTVKREQEKLFLAREQSLSAEVRIARGDGLRAHEDAINFNFQRTAQLTKMRLTALEFHTAEVLAQSGFGTRSRVIEIRRSLADMQQVLLDLQVKIADSQATADHDAVEAYRAKATFEENAGVELQQALRDQVDLILKLDTVEQQLTALNVRAPVSGHVVNLDVHTVGGVIQPGATIMEIVPEADPMAIEARVRPDDIDGVVVGLPVDVKLIGERGQRLPRLEGIVTRVSADRLRDPVIGTPFFRVRVILNHSSVEKTRFGEIRPGIPVTLMIRQGRQTPLAYLSAPITKFFTRALK